MESSFRFSAREVLLSPPLNKCPVGLVKYGNGGVIMEDSGEIHRVEERNDTVPKLRDPTGHLFRGGW